VEILYSLYVVLAGLALGSFLGMAVVRIPQRQSLVRPRSRCPHCGRVLPWYENIPLFSYLGLKGRCSGCGGKISPHYFLIELITAGLSLYAFWQVHPLGRFLLYELTLILPLILLFFLDWKYLILPDAVTLPGIVLGFVVRILDARFFHLLSHGIPVWKILLDSFLGALCGFMTLYILAITYRKLRDTEGLGGGDFKLSAMLGAFFGWKAIFFIFFLASALGILYGMVGILTKKFSRQTPLPFGSFLSGSALLYFFHGPTLLQAYLGLFKFK
jgi:leader peptidase (prepilin peptidase) / N-methyltransferase